MLQKKNKSKRKKKIAWLQACFLGDVRVIWCNFLGDSHFQTYVIDNVEIVLIFHLHITLWVSHILTSCTHHKQVFVKLYTCNCVFSFCSHPRFNFLMCLVHFGGVRKDKFDEICLGLKFSLQRLYLQNFWNHEHASHIIKN